MMKSLQKGDYQIGIICALSKEMTAVRAILDEEHAPLSSQDAQDHNSYVLGQIHEHNTVIACLPAGVYGTTSAANVCKDMSRTFENVCLGLMVGIGGGIPQKGRDIRLGDVVVSQPDGTHGGVLQYDLGKNLGKGKLERKGVLNKPPSILLTALSRLKSESDFHGDILSKNLAAVNFKHPILSDLYRYPGIDQDQLYCSQCYPPTLLGPSKDCEMCVNGKVQRSGRQNNDPVIHYGTIASGNQLLKNATFRDQLARDYGAICVEMEAAGMMDTYPCLVIRGICDYADSHKNDMWQSYAAITAAACAKEVLRYITKQHVKQETPVALLNTVNRHLEAQESRLSHLETQHQDKKRRECHQTLKINDYESFKNINPDAATGTCRWVLDNPIFKDWYRRSENDIIWISADPGCGKSVLSKSLVDVHLRPPHLSSSSDTSKGINTSFNLCYFFFKDNEQQNSLSAALCAMLHQLFSQQPTLVRHALSVFDKCGNKLPHDTHELWRILLSAASDVESRPTFCVLDGLDECRDTNQRQLIELLHFFIRDAKDNLSTTLKWLITSRPYVDIEDRFRAIAPKHRMIRLRGEDESDQIQVEINLVIRRRMATLAQELKLPASKKDEMTQQLLNMKNRTYLWLYLAIDEIKSTFRNSLRPAQETIVLLPNSVEAAYEKILTRVTRTDQRRIAQTILTIIVGARRALTTHEMAYALDLATLNPPPSSLSDLQIGARHVRDNIPQWCGLFVSISHNRLYLLHQTARDFLLSNADSHAKPQTGWKYCLKSDAVEREMTKICVLFLCLTDFNKTSDAGNRSHSQVRSFYAYSAQYWLQHTACSETIVDEATTSGVKTLYDTSAPRFGRWTSIMLGSISHHERHFSTDDLQVAAKNGYHVVTMRLLQGLASSDSPALDWAAYLGNLEVVRILLNYNAETKLQHNSGHTALYCESSQTLMEPREVSLRHGADVNLRDRHGKTALHRAFYRGSARTIELLLSRYGADINLQDIDGWTTLHKASRQGNRQVVKLLLNYGADANIRDFTGWTALHMASYGDDAQIVQLLLSRYSADINLRNNDGCTALHTASRQGNIQVAGLLLKHGIDADLQDSIGWTALHTASYGDNTPMIELLLSRYRANINLQNIDGWTALHTASRQGNMKAAELLLRYGADIHLQDKNGKTALHKAAGRGRIKVVELLLKYRANVNLPDSVGETALHKALNLDKQQVVELLLKHGADA